MQFFCELGVLRSDLFWVVFPRAGVWVGVLRSGLCCAGFLGGVICRRMSLGVRGLRGLG